MLNRLFLFILILFSGTSNLSADTQDAQLYPSQVIEQEVEKMQGYLDPSQIFFSKNSIFVLIDDVLKQVDAITSDANGLFLVFPSGKKDWQCPRCGHINNKSAKFCDNCLWDPKKDPIPFK